MFMSRVVRHPVQTSAKTLTPMQARARIFQYRSAHSTRSFIAICSNIHHSNEAIKIIRANTLSDY